MEDPEVRYSSPATRGQVAQTSDTLYENTELYENTPSPALAARFPAKPSSTSSSAKKPPAAKVTSKFLSADAKSKDAAQVINANSRMLSFTLLPHRCLD